ncbi:NtaA/DmoA family FMN-dependent monooxygenase [Xanthomonas hortorum pv. cynarae]|uniref:NtaA/DmoA family FMN-dependent monooxygenase n=1 Tax=Xanthomonas hortorum TaxID=56454 RepID=UPI000CED97A4|nr:NtaA/DmoA family FMN-dependent monooxygenase [Xanthomonas hortorum]MCC4625002.1 NtaA/DmoA family FMN-dependent monooxygenase [Xanthomonas campestris pv. nigromaculans]MCE4351298.1 NtaA/DmoA family FMN-dependent monooxygenase [Xanthomonas hortorum pv. cynarae]PPU37349.1 nitrilotriacetate monooxygenase [Xanthomonas hortorum pv. cynarae]CAD0344990.1 Putative monooxygenase MoxC [Xanthomonas hortorum pv. cynarae]CAD0344997.1 Putative monooxygenase MoxC [Xanthomonas hortorum pv. cynarae]
MRTSKTMIIGLHLGNGYGSQPGAWRMPWVDPTNYISFDARVRQAQAAERGKFQFIFLPDGPSAVADIDNEAPHFNLDVMMTLAAVARGTERIGLVATGSTTFNEPFNLARQFKALDIMSHGRAGWNAVTSSGEDVAANYGRTLPSSAERYARAHEVVQLVQALWGSWGKDAWLHDQAAGRFADAAQIAPINLQGKFVGSRGPLYIPPSEQGQPVIFHAGGGPNALKLAGRYASAVIGASFSIEDARAQRAAFRHAAEQAGRDPDEIKFIPGLMTTIAPDRRAALDRRIALTAQTFPQRLGYLQQMLGVRLDPTALDRPLSPAQLAAARPSSQDPRSPKALQIAREGWSLRDILAHGVIDYHPVIVGPAVEAADHMQAWFEADAADGFWISPDINDDGIDAFVDGVVPILQARGLFHRDYRGRTLRDHLGASAQYGRDPRITA